VEVGERVDEGLGELRVCAASVPPPNSGGTSRRTTCPWRRSITKKLAPMTLLFSQ
jgi:hypothetical protein